MLYRLVLALTLMVTSTASYAGAWVQPKGHGLYINQATYYGTSNYFDHNASLKSQPRFNKYEFQPYVEYGFDNKLTIGATAYAQKVSQSGNSNYGFADPEVFARLKIWDDDNQVISIQPLAKSRSYFRNENPPNGGSQTTDLEISVLYGRGLPIFTARDYVDVRVGYRARNKGLSDQVRFDVATGIKLNEKFEIVPAVRGVVATKPTDVAIYRETSDLDYSSLKAELAGIYHLNDNQWVQTSVFKNVYGAQTGAGYGASIGFAQRF